MIHTIHLHRDARPLSGDESGDSRFDGLQAIPDVKAKWALIFPPFWLAYHRLWWALTIYMLLAFLGLALLATPWFPVALLLGGLPGIYLFLEGHQLRRNRLEAKGFDMIGVVDARDPVMAIERYLVEGALPENPDHASMPKKPAQSSGKITAGSETLSIGLFPEREF